MERQLQMIYWNRFQDRIPSGYYMDKEADLRIVETSDAAFYA